MLGKGGWIMKYILAALILCVCSPSFAFFYNGNEMNGFCTTNKTYVLGYAAAAFDKAEQDQGAMFMYMIDNVDENGRFKTTEAEKSFATQSKNIGNYCAPKGVILGQVADVYCQYLQKNPAVRHQSAVVLFNNALSQAWPCKSK